MKKYFFVIILIGIIGCKSKQTALSSETLTRINQKDLIEKQAENKINFKTLYIKSSARYQDNNQSQNVTADIRIEKDEKILISIRVLGITMAKAFITKDRVQYYEKIDHTHFDGDFEGLSRWLGTSLDYHKIQNLLTGKPLYDLETLKLSYQLENNQFILSNSDSQLGKSFFFETMEALLTKQAFNSFEKQTTLSIFHKDFKDITDFKMPHHLQILATQVTQNVQITMDYNTVTVNEKFSFPYDVPNGSTQIFID